MYHNGITHPVLPVRVSKLHHILASHSGGSHPIKYTVVTWKSKICLLGFCKDIVTDCEDLKLLNLYQTQRQQIFMSLNVNIQCLSSLRALDSELDQANNNSRFRRIDRDLSLTGQSLCKLVIEVGVKRRIDGRYNLALE